MSYTREPLQVKPYRELPQEIMFDLKHAEQDKIKPNRYWFKFPENWALTNDKERIFGLRSSYVSRTQRHLQMKLSYGLFNQDVSKDELVHFEYDIDSYLDNDDTIKKFIKDFNIQSKEYYNAILNAPEIKPYVNYILPNKCVFKYEDNKCILEIYNPLNDRTDTNYYIVLYEDDVEYQKKKDLWQILTDQPEKEIHGKGTKLKFKCGWDRYHCYITSSISTLNNGSFLSHTDRTNNPIKYYRLSSTDDKFWIDLWSTRHHNVPSIMPPDNEDEIILECIVCFDSSAIL